MMKHIRMRAQRGPNASRYTHLSACVSQEDGGFTVQVRLYDEAKPEKGVWGEEVAASIEAASAMLGELAGAYSIPQARIKIRVRMGNAKEGTLH
jgi:hypothetical protein